MSIYDNGPAFQFNTNDPILSENNKVNPDQEITGSGGTVPDADAVTKGKIQLAGDLGGTADAPTVPNKQDKLVSGTNIKTINGNTILGGGDLVISGGTGISLTGTTRQVAVFNSGTTQIEANYFRPDHWSQVYNGAPTTGGTWVAAMTNNPIDPNQDMFFIKTVLIPEFGAIPIHDELGQLFVNNATDGGHAVNLNQLNSKVPNGGSATTFLRGDGTWVTPTNTTYAAITEAEFNTGTASTARAISAVSLNRDITKKLNDLIPIAPTTGTYTLRAVDGVLSWVEEV